MLTRIAVLLLASAAIAFAVLRLEEPYHGLVQSTSSLDGTPVTVQRRADAPPGPVVVIAHGFAGSRQLMQPFAVTLAQNGYVAVSFDFQGHGRNPTPLAGDVTQENGATRALLSELERVIMFARKLQGGDGRVALLGHSMASDIVVRAAVADPDIAATVAVSMFTREVTADAPRNLLVIVGEYENFLSQEALKAVALSTGQPATEAVTYGDPAIGTARRAVFADGTEHVSVLYSGEGLSEAVAWLDMVFDRTGSGFVETRGRWVILMLAGSLALVWPLSSLLPRIGGRTGVLSRGRFWVFCLAPAVVTPLVLWPIPTRFLPVLVADYLALHFLLYGALTLGGLGATGALKVSRPTRLLMLAAGAATVLSILVIAVPIDRYVASFLPGPDRLSLIGILALGTLSYTCGDAWLIGRQGARWWWYPASKLALIGSLALAVALNLEQLFFLIIILPVILLFFIVYGVMNRWIYRATRAPAVGGVALGIAFAWALGVTFPLLSG